jgi:hypothetical protein
MKWFKHETDAHSNLKLQSLITKYGSEAYGYYWSCIELVGFQGVNYRVKSDKDWKIYLKKFLEIDLPKQETYLSYFAQSGLIDKKALSKGDLFVPKMKERSDDYTNKVRRKSEHSTDNVSLEEKKEEKKRREKIKTVEVLESYIFENPIFPKLKKTYPHRDYELQFSLMAEWWQKNKNRLPQSISAFSNWLKNTKEDDSIRSKYLREQGAKDTSDQLKKMENVPGRNKLVEMKEKAGII